MHRVKRYRDDVPLFSRFQIEHQIETAYSRTVPLPSGGAIVIDHTEALVSVDVNSARATRGADIETTAFNTNLEAAEEVARQLRLRDLGGLIVIDFIDMESTKNQREIENRLKDALHFDRARVQMGKISRFGLMELSRQRLRPSLSEGSHVTCPRCNGTGHIRDTESSALQVLRIIQEEAMKENSAAIHVQAPVDVAAFLLNEKRGEILKIETRHRVTIIMIPNKHLETPHYKLERIKHDDPRLEDTQPSYDMAEQADIDIGYNKRQKEDIKPRQEAMVKSITPDQPAPIVERNKVEPALVVPASEPAEEGFLSRLFGFFRKKPTVPVAVSVAATAEKPQHRDRNERNGRGQRRNRGGRGRDKNEERDVARVEAREETAKQAQPETPATQQPRPPRAPREQNENRRERQRAAREERKELSKETPETKPEEKLLNGAVTSAGNAVTGVAPVMLTVPATVDDTSTSLAEGNGESPVETTEQGDERRRRRRRGGRNRNRRDRESGEAMDSANGTEVLDAIAETETEDNSQRELDMPKPMHAIATITENVIAVAPSQTPAAIEPSSESAFVEVQAEAIVEVLPTFAPAAPSITESEHAKVVAQVEVTEAASVVIAETSVAMTEMSDTSEMTAPLVQQEIPFQANEAAAMPVATSPAAAQPTTTQSTAPQPVMAAPIPLESLQGALNAAGLTLAVTDPEKLRAVQEKAKEIVPMQRVPRERKTAPPLPAEPLIQVETRH